MNSSLRTFLKTLPLFIIVTAFSSMIYLVNQQVVRTNFDAPNAQIVRNLSEQLKQGKTDKELLPPNSSKLESFQDVFVLFFDKDANSTGGSATLDDKTPSVDKTLIENAKNNEDSRFTWKPKNNLSFGAIAKYYKTEKTEGYFMIANSLKDLESNTKKTDQTIVIGWAITMLLVLISCIVADYIKYSNSTKSSKTLVEEVKKVTAIKKGKSSRK